VFPEKEFELGTKDRREDKMEIQCFKAVAFSTKDFFVEKKDMTTHGPNLYGLFLQPPSSHSALTAIQGMPQCSDSNPRYAPHSTLTAIQGMPHTVLWQQSKVCSTQCSDSNPRYASVLWQQSKVCLSALTVIQGMLHTVLWQQSKVCPTQCSDSNPRYALQCSDSNPRYAPVIWQ
jgi:hypothetical protein